MGRAFKKQQHDFGNSLGTIPDVRQCKRCGGYEEVPDTRGEVLDDFGTAHLSDLPREIFTNMAQAECPAVLAYTEFQYKDAVDSAYRHGWYQGQQKGIHLQPEFTQQFFKKIRMNPNTLTYEIPSESYELLKQQVMVTDLASNNPEASAELSNPLKESL